MSSAGPQSIAEIALGTDPGANKELYDGWAQKYTADVDNWGYDAPARVAALLKEHLGDTGCAEVEVLDEQGESALILIEGERERS